MRLRFAESGIHAIPKPGHAGKKTKPVRSQRGLFLTRSHSLPVPGTGQAWTCLVRGINSHTYVHITGKCQPLSWLHSWGWQALLLCWNNRAARGSSCQRLLSTHPHLLPTPRPSSFLPPQCTVFLSFPVGIYTHFTLCSCFPEPPALHLYCIWCKCLHWGTTLRSRSWKRHWESFFPQLRSLVFNTCVCVYGMLESTLELLCPSLLRMWRPELMYIGQKDANDRDSNLGCLAWDRAGTLMPQFPLCSRCQGFGFFPWTAALKYLT